MNVLALVRDDLRDFAGYKSARSEALRGDVWLNANESAWSNPADGAGGCRRHREPWLARIRPVRAPSPWNAWVRMVRCLGGVRRGHMHRRSLPAARDPA